MLPKSATMVIPAGCADYVPEFGFSDYRELFPWTVFNSDGVLITAVPVSHFNGRYGFDGAWMNYDSYTGYIIEYQGKTVFFAGDTGYDSQKFKEIGRRYAIDLALIPIAPVEPREYMKNVHADPEEAVQIFEACGARLMIPMHYHTFFQGLDPTPDHAERLLADAVRTHHLEDRVLPLRIGEQRTIIPE
jgi:L-ascorbate metabolism protein UlaG (beta-lactamase superfamily)